MNARLPTHPFRTPRLSGPQVGWWRPIAAVLLAMAIPAAFAMLVLFIDSPVLSGTPKDGSGYTVRDHIEMFVACLAASFVMSWMIAPIAVILLRASAMLGWAGWGSAIFSALAFGMPAVHFGLNGDVTTESQILLPHITVAIMFLGLSVWGAFWALMAHAQKSPNFPSI